MTQEQQDRLLAETQEVATRLNKLIAFMADARERRSCKREAVETYPTTDVRLQKRMQDTQNTTLFGVPSDIENLVREDALLGFGDTKVLRMQARSLMREVYLKALYGA